MKVRPSVKRICENCKVIRRTAASRSSARTPVTSSARAEETRMARIAGVDIPREKRLEIALTYVFGIGRRRHRRSVPTWASAPTRGCATSPTTR
jgi:hypothetical protein